MRAEALRETPRSLQALAATWEDADGKPDRLTVHGVVTRLLLDLGQVLALDELGAPPGEPAAV